MSNKEEFKLFFKYFMKLIPYMEKMITFGINILKKKKMK